MKDRLEGYHNNAEQLTKISREIFVTVTLIIMLLIVNNPETNWAATNIKMDKQIEVLINN